MTNHRLLRNTLLVLLASTLALTAQAQNKTTQTKDTTVNRRVQIEKDYEPEIGNHKRANIELQVEKPKVQPAQTEYSHYTISLKPENQAATISATKPCDTTLNHETPNKGYARIGFGPLWVESVDFWYPILNSKDGYFDVGIHHNGALQGETKKHPAKHYLNTAADINFSKSFNPGTLYLNLGYQNEWFNYYGDNELGDDLYQYLNFNNEPVYRYQLMPEHQSLNRLAFTLGMRSDGVLSSNWFYNAYLGYNVLTTTNRLQEHQIRGGVNTGMMVGMHKLDINLSFLGIIYGSQSWNKQEPITSATALAYPYLNNGQINLAPAYVMRWKKLNLRLGVKANFAFYRNRHIAVSPDVTVDYTVSDIINFFGGVTGDYETNSLWNVLNTNRYYAVERAICDNTYIPVDAFVGFKLKPVKGLNITADFHYKMLKDALFYHNNGYVNGIDPQEFYAPNFAADQADADLLTFGLKASYNHNERFLVYARMQYNKWMMNDSIVSPWHKPTWEFGMGAEAKIYKGLSANLDFTYNSPSTTRLGNNTLRTAEVGPMYDLNFGADYQFPRHWSLFLELNNLVAIGGINYQPWYGYNTIGFNAMVGAKVRF